MDDLERSRDLRDMHWEKQRVGMRLIFDGSVTVSRCVHILNSSSGNTSELILEISTFWRKTFQLNAPLPIWFMSEDKVSSLIWVPDTAKSPKEFKDFGYLIVSKFVQSLKRSLGKAAIAKSAISTFLRDEQPKKQPFPRVAIFDGN